MRSCLGLLVWLLLGVPIPGSAGEVQGRVEVALGGARLADVGPFFVHLEAIDAPVPDKPPAEVPIIRQSGARFSPPILVVAAGQKVEMRNDDRIYHNVFSYSVPNDFDLGRRCLEFLPS